MSKSVTQASIENISENELLPTVQVSKDDLFLKPSVNYYKEKIISRNARRQNTGCCRCLFYYLCLCCLCKSRRQANAVGPTSSSSIRLDTH